MEVKIKRLSEDAIIPKYAKPGDAGMDLIATSVSYDVNTNTLTYSTGLAVAIPKGYVGLIFPRSSVYKQQLQLANNVGVIDSGYRGEIKLIFRDLAGIHKDNERIYVAGDRIAQLMIVPYPTIKFKEVDRLDNTERGDGGFGSSGN